MFSDLEFIDYRYAKLRPFGNAKSKNESVLLLKNTSTTGDQKAESEPLVKRSFAKKRQCSPLVETENIGGSGSTSIKRIKSPFPVEDGHLTVMSGYGKISDQINAPFKLQILINEMFHVLQGAPDCLHLRHFKCS